MKRKIGSSPLTVPPLGLGCMGMSAFYGMSDDRLSVESIQAALHCGIKLFDTADMYGDGHNEELLGRTLKNCRHDVVLATKAGIYRENGRSLSNGRKQYIIDACERSLHRLDTDYIDLYQYDRPDRNVPIEESLEAFRLLTDSGKVRYIGVSNFTAEQLEQAAACFPLVSIQNEHSLLNKSKNEAILSCCERRDLALLAYSSLGRGLLAGKRAETLGTDDYRATLPWYKGRDYRDIRAKVRQLQQLAELKATNTASLALAWLIRASTRIIPIAGARSPEQVKANAEALTIELAADEFEFIRALFEER